MGLYWWLSRKYPSSSASAACTNSTHSGFRLRYSCDEKHDTSRRRGRVWCNSMPEANSASQARSRLKPVLGSSTAESAARVCFFAMQCTAMWEDLQKSTLSSTISRHTAAASAAAAVWRLLEWWAPVQQTEASNHYCSCVNRYRHKFAPVLLNYCYAGG